MGRHWLRDFFQLDAAKGILLVAMALFAMVLENSPLAWLYDALLATPVEIRVG
ncbi:MAG: Na(+)/H(+) antiporter NhaA, partial [Nitrospirae bacterium CG_4_8_14_3_um_filter_70_85]